MSAPLRVLLVDDEPPAQRALTRMLEAIPDLELVGTAGNGLEALAVLADTRVDLLLLDIQMPVLTGLALAARLQPQASPAVVFVTAWPQHALDAFGLGAADYLLKPVDPDRLVQAIARARVQLAAGEAAQRIAVLEASLRALRAGTGQTNAPFVWADTGTSRTRLALREIDWFAGDGDYVQAHTAQRSYLLRETLRELEGRFPQLLLRIHRSTLVNVDAVQAVVREEGQLVLVTRSGTRLAVGRRSRARVRDLLGNP